MDKNYTHILFILDDSGSMSSILDDAIGGFNSFLNEQKKLNGKCKMHTMLFGSHGNIKYLHENKDINNIDNITIKDYNAGSGLTALIDAIGIGITDLGKFLREMDENDRPSKVLVNIFTDGEENDSREYTEDKIREMIKEQTEKYNWEFAFLASDISSVSFANRAGFSNVASVDKGGDGIRSMYTSMTLNATSYRTKGKTINVQEAYDDAMNNNNNDDDDENND